MKIKEIRFIDEVRDKFNDSVDVGVEFEDGYSYTIIVRTPADFTEQMLQEKSNFIEPGTPMIVVKELTEEIVNEAIKAYAEDDGYWLKLCQFGDELDISVLNQMDAEYRNRKELKSDDLDGLN